MTLNLIENNHLNRSAAVASLQKFLNDTISSGKFALQASVRSLPEGTAPDDGGAEVFAELSGRDTELLLERGAELLQSIEHLAHRALRLEPPFQDKIFLDCSGYRALRIEELKMMARTAAERVQASKQPFKLNPMNSRERRIVHLALQSLPGIRTESIGLGPHRQVVIHPATPAANPPR
ncbi:MAG TPA: R3H domain-containing nucleic acid-binding protein [Candidatus Acidoferrum sp.]|nr:R3H domain-containing nucleic acid-binding protein [Candidatus Acidoferrum sp.]